MDAPRPPATRTKIVATLGPAVDPPGVLERMLAAGVDVLRINLSHGTMADHARRLARARAARPDVAVLADLSGPKLRLGELADPVTVRKDEVIALGAGGLPVQDPAFASRVRVGDPVYVADGTVRLEATRVDGACVTCRVIVGGALATRKGINLPADDSDAPALTDKDRRDIADLAAIAPDYLALSYVRSERDIADLRALSPLPIVAKIEKRQAVERLGAILAAADALMVARGDLGVEIPIEQVPATQKRVIRAANIAGKPVITATQMLVSMVSSPLPTRAEVTDVANAVLDGTDAVMLSEETASGHDPAAAVAMMERILHETEPLSFQQVHPDTTLVQNALAQHAARLSETLEAAALLAPTKSGITAWRLASFRPRAPILAFTRRPETLRRLALVWGVSPHLLPPDAEEALLIPPTMEAARKLLPEGARVVLLSLGPPADPHVPQSIRTVVF